MFYRSATIIISFIHQLTNSCDVNNHRNWSQLSYDQFSDELLELSSVSADEDHDDEHGDHDDEHGEHSDDDDHEHHDSDHGDDDGADHHDEHVEDEHEHEDGEGDGDNDEHHDHDHENHDYEHGEHSDDDDDDDDYHHDEDEGHEEKYFTTGQLEYLLRQVADSYQPGKSVVLDGLPREQLDFDCSFGNLKVWLLLF